MKVKKEERVAGETGALRSSTEGKGRYDCVLLGYPHMIFRLARLLEQGIASGYPAGNWKKGTDLRRWLEGGFRHLCQFAEGKEDEDHLIAAIWNLMSLGETKHLIDNDERPIELDNLPFTPKLGDRRIDPENGREQIYAKRGKLEPGDHYVDPETGQKKIYTQLQQDFDRAVTAAEITNPPHATFYICGPMRGYPFLNFPAFDGARDLGHSLGFNIISPADIDRENGIDPIEDPGVIGRIAEQAARDSNFLRKIVIRDLATIINLDPENGSGLALLPGWEDSTGATAEIAVAHWLNLPFVDATTFRPIADPLEV